MWDPRSGIPWRPTKRQEEFIEVPFNVFEALYGGAAGGGKSELLIMLPIIYKFHTYPYYHGVTFRESFPQLEASIIKRAVPIYEAIGGTYNAQKHVFRFNSGAEQRFSYLLSDADARQHDTEEYNLACFDELTAFTEFRYKYVSSRVRSSSNLPSIIRSASNPGNIGHLWVRDRFVSPSLEGGALIRDLLTRQYRIFIRAMLADNPYLEQSDPQYKLRLQILPEADRRAKLDGDWFIFTGQVFSEFRQLRLSDEPDNALHVVSPFTIPSYWPRVLAIDWGYDAMTYAAWAAIGPDGKIFIYREYSCRKTSIEEWSSDIQRLSQAENIVLAVIDPSSRQNRGTKTVYQQFIESTNFPFVSVADNDRVGGKMLIHELLRFRPRPPKYVPPEGFNQDTSDHILRMYGLDAQKEYISAFLPDVPETNIPRLQIFDSCPILIKTLPLCVYDEKRNEDVKEFAGDDPYDTLRYLLKACEKWGNAEYDTMKEHKERSAIIAEYERSGDANRFYRRMAAFDKKYASPEAVYH